DAQIMDGTTMNAGAVASLRRVRNAVGVARAVLEHTAHTLLAGDQALAFAVENGFAAEDLTTGRSADMCAQWRAGKSQPNYRVNAVPNATQSCGPYRPAGPDGTPMCRRGEVAARDVAARPGHDTISMIAIHESGAMASATSTNGLTWKIPGRVGDG